jgi:spore coat protein H
MDSRETSAPVRGCRAREIYKNAWRDFMSSKKFIATFVVACLLSSPACLTSLADEDELFGLTKVHTVHIAVSADDYRAMEPPPRRPGFGPGPPGGAPRPGRPAFGSPDFGAGNFGFEFEYVRSRVTFNDQELENVGLRYKGSGTYMMSARQAKRSLKLDFDRYGNQQTLHGKKKLNLNSGVMDPTKAREALAYQVFRQAGVPCPRTSLAEVTLTVPGKFDRELLGAYTVVEQVDKQFLKAHFGSSKGLLLKPEGIRGLPHFGDDPKVYAESYLPKTDGSAEDWRKLVELTSLINRADESEFRDRIGELLDLDNFARFLAANAALSSLDGFLGLGHNYYLYRSPESGKFVFLPWDLDLAFGAFPMYGTPEQLVELSVEHPHLAGNKLIDRFLGIPEAKENYRAHLRRLSEEVFTSDQLGADLRSVGEALKPLLEREQRAQRERREAGGGLFGAAPIPLEVFVERRKASIDSQLAGTAQGYVPATRGFGGGFGGGPPRGR